MANALSWPSGLPCPVLGSDPMTIDLALDESEMEGGGLRTRQRYNNYPAQSSMTLVLNRYEASRFFSFVAEAAGASFDIDLETPEDPYAKKSTCSVRIIGNVRRQNIGGGVASYSVSIFIERMEPAAPDGFYLFDYYGGFDGLANAANLLDRLANVSLPNALDID